MRKPQPALRKDALAAVSLFAIRMAEAGIPNEDIVDALLWAAKATRRHRSQRAIYVLRDPLSRAIRYVGCAIDPAKRLKAHWTQSQVGESGVAVWIRALRDAGIRPILEVVETVCAADWESAERRWVANLRQTHHDLLNVTDGGAGAPGWSATIESREARSRAYKGRKQSPEAIAKTAAALRGKKKSPEHCAALSAVRKGKVPFAACEAAARATRGKPKSAEHRARIGAANKGRMNGQRKLSDADAGFIRRNRGILSQRALAGRFGVGVATIHSIQTGRRYVLTTAQGSLF